MFSSQRVKNTVEAESVTTSGVICLDYTGGKKNRQDYLQNDYLQFNENAVVAKNTYENGCSENLRLVKTEHFKYHHCIEALEVICLSS